MTGRATRRDDHHRSQARPGLRAPSKGGAGSSAPTPYRRVESARSAGRVDVPFDDCFQNNRNSLTHAGGPFGCPPAVNAARRMSWSWRERLHVLGGVPVSDPRFGAEDRRCVTNWRSCPWAQVGTCSGAGGRKRPAVCLQRRSDNGHGCDGFFARLQRSVVAEQQRRRSALRRWREPTRNVVFVGQACCVQPPTPCRTARATGAEETWPRRNGHSARVRTV